MANETGSSKNLSALCDAYVAALLARDAARLPLSPTVRFTENGQSISLRDGLFTSATPDPAPVVALRVADSAAQQVACFAAVGEHGRQVLLSARLRVVDGAITELETLVCRGLSAFELFAPADLDPERLVFDPLPADEVASSREELVAVANAYFDGIEQDRGDEIPVLEDCLRFENGVQTILAPPRNDEPFAQFGSRGVAGQISTGMFRYIERIAPRRYPVVDLERGLVFGIVCFEHPGRHESVEVAGVGTVPLPVFARTPSTAIIAELFHVRAGQIAQIEALLDFFPYGMATGWED